MEKCPDIEVRGTYVFIRNEGRRTMVPVAILSEFDAKARLALMEVSEQHGTVVPFRTKSLQH